MTPAAPAAATTLLGRRRPAPSSSAYAKRIAELDDRLVRTIGERRNLTLAVGQLKAALGLPVMDPAQEAKVVRNAANRARELGVDEEMTRDVMWRIIAFARKTQEAGQAAPGENG